MSNHFVAVVSNTGAQLVSKFFGAGLTLLTTYFTIKLAGLELYGDLTKILVLVALGFTVTDFGLNADAIRRSPNQQAMQKNLLQVIFARLALSLFMVLSLNLLVRILPGGYSPEVKSVFWFGSLAIIFQGIVTSGNAYFQYSLHYWHSTLSVVLGSLTATLLTLYFLWHSPSLFTLTLATTLGYLVMAATTLFLLRPHLTLSSPLSFNIVSTLKRAALLGLILSASVLSSKIDTILLGIFRSSSEVGQYGFAYRIFDVVLVLPVFAMNALYPLMLSSSQKLLRPTLKYLGILGVVAGIVTYSAAPLIFYIRPGLDLSILTLRLLSLSLPLFYLTAPLMWHLIANHRDHVVLKIYLAAASFNCLVNYLTIPRYGTLSAALTTGATELLIFLSLLYYSLNPTNQKTMKS